MTIPIPSPPRLPFLGNVGAVESDVPVRSFVLLAKQYGPIYSLAFPGRTVIFCNSYELQNELSDETRFDKLVGGGLKELRHGIGDGLFTAHTREPNWGVAHRLLMPAFSTITLHGMMDDMLDICSQLLLKWDRFGPNHVIDPTEDFTRLTLDTICLCAMSYRLNSFYRETQHPFVDAMTGFLGEGGRRAQRPGIVQAFMTGAQAQFDENIQIMGRLANELIADRKANPTDSKDSLNVMLNGKDSKTGQGLSDDSIRYNLLTFLIAGHETTSGMLSFTTYHLLKNPEAMAKLRAEIDEVVGDRVIQREDLSKMPYLTAVMRESLRLSPTAPARGVYAKQDTTLCGGKYAVKANSPLVLQQMITQRDPAVWGEDADEFRPERMLDGKFEALPPNAWQPFGFGMRGCIGRAFALQEAHIVLASVFQKFDLVMDDPSYSLELKQTLTIKPLHFRIRAIPRKGRRQLFPAPSTAMLPARAESASVSGLPNTVPSNATADAQSMQPLYLLYGSNTGSCEAFAQRLANNAAAHGFRARLGTMDSAAEHLSTDGPTIILTASYEGEPPDNASHFVEWLSLLKGNELAGVSYAVFGCGNKDWVQTYQKIPKICDQAIEQRGGKRLIGRGEADASDASFFQVFETFEAELWKVLMETYRTTESTSSESISIKVVDAGTSRSTALRQPEAALGVVLQNRRLTKEGVPEKRHIEFELPEGMSSHAGDYLAIVPHNPPRDVHRALSRFKMSAEQEVVISSAGPTTLPVDKPVMASALLSGYVELSQPATTGDIRLLIEKATTDKSRDALLALAEHHPERVVASRTSVLDVLEAHPDIDIPFGVFLSMLPAMRIRQYSISSSPLANPQTASLTVSVLDAPALSGREDRFLGVGSTYLASLRPGDRVIVSVRPSAVAFKMPSDPSTPCVMFCAGAGLAPFRGFIEERAAQKAAGRTVGKMLLFFGCRSPQDDYLYMDAEMGRWVQEGVVDVRPAFSRSPEDSHGCKYVQDRIWHDREDIKKAWDEHAKFYTCGSGHVAAGVKDSAVKLIREGKDWTDERAALAWDRVKGRYATDIFD